MPAPASRQARFWAYCASFGALWGAVEVTAGSFLHTLRIPLAGLALAVLAAILLIAQRQLLPVRGLTLATGVVAALCKTASPGGIILNPMVAILVEATLIELVLSTLPGGRVSAVTAGTLAVTWSVTQKVITQVVLYGGDVVELALEVLRRAGEVLGLAGSPGTALASGLAIGLFALGLLGGLTGHRVGVAAARQLSVAVRR